MNNDLRVCKLHPNDLMQYNQELNSCCNNNSLEKIKELIRDNQFNTIDKSDLVKYLDIARDKEYYEIAEVLIASSRVLQEVANYAKKTKIPLNILERYIALSEKYKHYKIAKELKDIRDNVTAPLKSYLGVKGANEQCIVNNNSSEHLSSLQTTLNSKTIIAVASVASVAFAFATFNYLKR